MGMTIVLAATLAAFEWASADPKETIKTGSLIDDYTPDVIVPVTRPEVRKPDLPPLNIKIVDNAPDIPDADITFNVAATENFLSDITKLWTNKEPEEKGEDIPILNPQQMPRYHHGGLENFRDHIQQIVKYPDDAISMGIDGKVYVSFVVDKNGKITNIQILKGVCPLLDNAVVDAIRKSDTWEPGLQMGRPVSVAMSMPVVFRLNQ